MTAGVTTAVDTGRGGTAEALRWAACLALMLGLHAGAAWLLLRHVRLPDLPPPAPEAVMLDLAPEPAPPAPEPAAPQPEPQPQEAAPPPPVPTVLPELPAPVEEPPPPREPSPPEPVPAAVIPEPPVAPPPPPILEPEVALPEPPPPPPPPPPRPVPPRPAPPPRPVSRPQPPRPARQSLPAVPATEPSPASPAVATPLLAAAPPSNAVPNWRGELIGRLQRAKRYPNAARSRGDQGVATATFTMDRDGRVLSANLIRSSGSPALDEEALALIRRAEPLPPMPAELAGNTVTLTVPVTFSLR